MVQSRGRARPIRARLNPREPPASLHGVVDTVRPGMARIGRLQAVFRRHKILRRVRFAQIRRVCCYRPEV